jgi:hypothetical protein
VQGASDVFAVYAGDVIFDLKQLYFKPVATIEIISTTFVKQVTFLLLRKAFWRELLSRLPSSKAHHIPFVKAQRIFCFQW